MEIGCSMVGACVECQCMGKLEFVSVHVCCEVWVLHGTLFCFGVEVCKGLCVPPFVGRGGGVVCE